jgi:hypothetical protein
MIVIGGILRDMHYYACTSKLQNVYPMANFWVAIGGVSHIVRKNDRII